MAQKMNLRFKRCHTLPSTIGIIKKCQDRRENIYVEKLVAYRLIDNFDGMFFSTTVNLNASNYYIKIPNGSFT